MLKPITSLANWLDDRTGLLALVGRVLNRPIPGGARWGHALGFALASTLVVDLVTGLFLMTTYSPSSTMAWGSVFYITHGMELGWFVRGLHRYASFGVGRRWAGCSCSGWCSSGRTGLRGKSTGGWRSGRSC